MITPVRLEESAPSWHLGLNARTPARSAPAAFSLSITKAMAIAMCILIAAMRRSTQMGLVGPQSLHEAEMGPGQAAYVLYT